MVEVVGPLGTSPSNPLVSKAAEHEPARGPEGTFVWHATVKKLYREAAGKIRLQPANPTMEPIFVDAANVRIQGVVVGVIRKY